MRSPSGEGTMATLKDVTERSCWSSDARTSIIPNPGECSPGIKPPGRREHENLAEEPAGDRPLLQRPAPPNLERTPSSHCPVDTTAEQLRGSTGDPRRKAATDAVPEQAKDSQSRGAPLPAAVLLRSLDAGPAHWGLNHHSAPGNILERR